MDATSTAILLGLLLPLQDGGGRSLAQKDAAAARAITQEFGLSRWSDKLLDRSLANAKSSDDRAELLLARCDILRLTALRTVDEKERLGILGEAGRSYGEFLDANTNPRNVADAQENLGNLTYLYARTLSNLIDSGQLTTAERDEAVAVAEEVFKSGLQVINGIIDRSEPGDADYAPAVFNRAMIYRYWAAYYPSGSLERKQYGNRAVGYLEEFAIAANVYPSMLAYTALADVYSVLEQYQDSADYYDYVIANCQDVLQEDLDPEFAVAIEGAVQGGFAGKLNMLRAAGDAAGFEQTYQDFVAWLDDSRVELNNDGYLAELAAADQLIDNGMAGDALTKAKEVADANPQSYLRLKANAVMGRAIKAAPADAVIPLDILFGAAEGAFFEKRYEDAVGNFRLLIPRLAGSAEAEDYGARAYYLLGRSWTSLDQDLFAAVAHEQGYIDYPEAEGTALQNAEQWERITGRFLSASPEDRAIEAWHDEALIAVRDAGGGGGDILWNEARRLEGLVKGAAEDEKARALRRAIDAYAEVESNSSNYERALVKQATLTFDLIPFDPGATDRALEMFTSYLEDYITAEANTPSDPKSRKVRKESEPTAAFFVGRTWRAKALAGDAAAWEQVLTAFEAMREKYPDQSALADDAMRYRVQAFVQLGRMDEAIAEYEAMVAVPAMDSRISVGAFYIYSAWTAAVEAAEGGETRLAAKENQLKYLSAYNGYAPNPRWQNLLGEANLQMELDQPDKAVALYQRILDEFGSAPDMTDGSRFSARMGYVEGLLAQRRVGEAVPVVEELVASRPKNLRVKIAVVKVKAGFLAWDGRTVLEVPGEGTAEALALASEMAGDLVQLAEFEAKQAGQNPFYYAPWWEAKLMQSYVFYQRGKTNPADQGKHKRLVENLQRQDPTLGEAVAGRRVSQSLKWLLLR
ncbi:MAG: hypothetical protein ACYTF3_00265 [Planctomycetota bacterium]|jgi:hypothetical protein